ncbi:hypothetical protein D3C79_778820 [compost metagenome]
MRQLIRVTEGLLVGEVEIDQHRAAATIHGEVDVVAERPRGQRLAHLALGRQVGVAPEVLLAKQLIGTVVVEIELEGTGALAAIEQLLIVTHLSILVLCEKVARRQLAIHEPAEPSEGWGRWLL